MTEEMLRARRVATLLAWRHARRYSRAAGALFVVIAPLTVVAMAIASAAHWMIPAHSVFIGCAAVLVAMILVLDASARRTGAAYNYRAALSAGATT